jgi:hypothetical protein
LFQSEKSIGLALALTIGVSAILMGITFWATYRPYRIHFRLAQASRTP